jgi:hypothetical protein
MMCVLVVYILSLSQIAINGEHYTEFRHRIPMQRINTIAIDGDVQLFAVRYEGGVSVKITCFNASITPL